MPPIPTPLAERIPAKVTIDPATGCWNWNATIDSSSGYGRIRTGTVENFDRRWTYAHIVSYETFVGPVPEGFDVDHLCRNRACCNPDHLEPVTRLENIRRGYKSRGEYTHCKNGHEWTAETTYTFPSGKRNCRTCRTETRLGKKKTAAEGSR